MTALIYKGTKIYLHLQTKLDEISQSTFSLKKQTATILFSPQNWPTQSSLPCNVVKRCDIFLSIRQVASLIPLRTEPQLSSPTGCTWLRGHLSNSWTLVITVTWKWVTLAFVVDTLQAAFSYYAAAAHPTSRPNVCALKHGSSSLTQVPSPSDQS